MSLNFKGLVVGWDSFQDINYAFLDQFSPIFV